MQSTSVDETKQLKKLAELRFEHARRCKSDMAECKHCQANMKWFNGLPLPLASVVLSNEPAASLHTSLLTRLQHLFVYGTPKQRDGVISMARMAAAMEVGM